MENFELAAVRRKKIVDLVRAHGCMGVRDLCDQFGMSEATIRRDLKQLDDKGLVARTHGGVMANANVTVDLPNEERKSLGAEEKRRIGIASIEMLDGDEVVFLDAGTTALCVAANAHKRSGCTYVTTSLGVANELKSCQAPNFFIIGGSYQRVNDSFVGTLAISALKSLSFDIAFLCCSSVDIRKRSISLGSEVYSQVQKEAIAASRQAYVVVDHSKFKAGAFVQTASFDDINGFITTKEVDDNVVSRLRDTGLEVVFA